MSREMVDPGRNRDVLVDIERLGEALDECVVDVVIRICTVVKRGHLPQRIVQSSVQPRSMVHFRSLGDLIAYCL